MEQPEAPNPVEESTRPSRQVEVWEEAGVMARVIAVGKMFPAVVRMWKEEGMAWNHVDPTGPKEDSFSIQSIRTAAHVYSPQLPV